MRALPLLPGPMLSRPSGCGGWPIGARGGRQRWRGCTGCWCGSRGARSPGAGRGWRSPAPNWTTWPTRPRRTRCWPSPGKLGQFRGESRFTTWACKFVILEVSAKLGRHFWRHPAVPLDAEDWDRLPGRFGFDPAQEAEWRDLLAAVRRAVDDELTPRQRQVFVAIVLNDVPLDALALELASNRNAIYKMLFDARRKLRAALAANGYLGHDIVGHS